MWSVWVCKQRNSKLFVVVCRVRLWRLTDQFMCLCLFAGDYKPLDGLWDHLCCLYLVIKWALLSCLPKSIFSLLLVTRYGAEMNLRVCKQLTLVEHAVIRAWKWFSPFALAERKNHIAKAFRARKKLCLWAIINGFLVTLGNLLNITSIERPPRRLSKEDEYLRI